MWIRAVINWQIPFQWFADVNCRNALQGKMDQSAIGAVDSLSTTFPPLLDAALVKQKFRTFRKREPCPPPIPLKVTLYTIINWLIFPIAISAKWLNHKSQFAHVDNMLRSNSKFYNLLKCHWPPPSLARSVKRLGSVIAEASALSVCVLPVAAAETCGLTLSWGRTHDVPIWDLIIRVLIIVVIIIKKKKGSRVSLPLSVFLVTSPFLLWSSGLVAAARLLCHITVSRLPRLDLFIVLIVCVV